MSAIYRRYRPTQFTGVIGQDHITKSLQSALQKEMIAHAYLFSGPRGTGKTTMARLFAKALNCPKRTSSAEACDKCTICQEIKNSSAVDIIEIDAASNRGIDEMRELRERILFSPTSLKYKVYIIDEVHMLTKEAFNALLKTLEEPPAHAIFILATTELHKVPDTIISRCQRFQFHRASIESLHSVLIDIAKKEKITLTNDAIQLIAERADGSFRDALTILGSVSAHGSNLGAEQLREILGLPSEQVIAKLLELVIGQDPLALATFLQKQLRDGQDLSVMVRQLCDRLKATIFDEKDPAVIQKNATLLEQCLLVLARIRVATDPNGIIVTRLLALVKSGAVPGPVPVVQTNTPTPKVTDLTKKENEFVNDQSSTQSVDSVSSQESQPLESKDFWGAFLLEIKQHNHALYMLVRSAKLLELTDSKLVLAVKFRFYSERLFETKNRKLVEEAASKIQGKRLILECQVKSDIEEAKPASGEDVMNTVVDVFELEEVAS
jgi:DNA polymerase III subunit gamma/tau